MVKMINFMLSAFTTIEEFERKGRRKERRQTGWLKGQPRDREGWIMSSWSVADSVYCPGQPVLFWGSMSSPSPYFAPLWC
jgi:hypothetical protein